MKLLIPLYGLMMKLICFSKSQWSTVKIAKFTCIQARRLEMSQRRWETTLVYCSVRDWTRFCHVIWFESIQIHGPHIIRFVADLFFSPPESGLKNIRISRRRIRWMYVDGNRIRKEKDTDSSDSKISGADMCRWGPNALRLSSPSSLLLAFS